MENFTVINKGKTAGKAVMMLTGMVSFFNGEQSFSASKFIKDFNALKENNTHIHIDIVNLYGGSITEGIPVYNHIKETAEAGDIKITGKIDGLAASMGSIIAMGIPVENLEMGNYARLMNHRAKGGGYGTADEVRNAANTIESYEDDLAEILAERTGWTTEEVRNKWMDGEDHYIKSAEAKKIGLVGKTSKSKVIKSAPKNDVAPEEAFNFYQTQITNAIETDFETIENKNEDMKLLHKFATAFALASITIDPTNATEESILDEVTNLAKNNKKLTENLEAANTKLQEQKDLAVKNLVASARKNNLIKESQEESLTTMAENDLDAAQKFVNALTPHTPLNEKLNGGKGGDGNPGNENDPEKTFDWYRKNDSKALAEMQAKDPEAYNALKEAHLAKK